MSGSKHKSRKAQIAISAPCETLPVPAPNFLPVSVLVDSGLLEIMADDHSIARKVYETSSDKEHPDYQPVLRFLRQEGYKRLESVSRLPALQEQGRYEEIADLLLNGPDADYLDKFTGDVQHGFIFGPETDRIRGWARPEYILGKGMENVGVVDSDCVELFMSMDIVNLVPLLRKKYTSVFTEIPQDGPDSLRIQRDYLKDWKETLATVGKNAIKQELRELGVDERDVKAFPVGMVHTNWPATTKSLLTQLRKGKSINKAIQSLEFYVRDGEKYDHGDVFAFVERAEPKGLEIVCYMDCSPAEVLNSILSKGYCQVESTKDLVMELNAVQKYQDHVYDRATKLGAALVLGSGAAFFALGVYTGHPVKASFIGACLTVATSCAVAGFGRSLSEYMAKRSIQRLSSSLPFPGLSEQARRNYLMIYRLEGLTKALPEPEIP